MIPKTIHYCWFGGKEIPQVLQEYMSSWKILEDAGYKIIRWDETNCSFDENNFVKAAYAERRWAFISDYYRLKALHEHGGIYLDTDVIIYKPFDDLLEEQAFVGYMHSCDIATSVIGAEKNSSFIKKMLNMYETGCFTTVQNVLLNETEDNIYIEDNWPANNECITWNIIKLYPEILLNNKWQRFSDFIVLPYGFLDGGRIDGHEYCRHMYTNLWRSSLKEQSSILKMIRKTIVYRRIKACKTIFGRMRAEKKTTFYRYRKEIAQRREAYSKESHI